MTEHEFVRRMTRIFQEWAQCRSLLPKDKAIEREFCLTQMRAIQDFQISPETILSEGEDVAV